MKATTRKFYELYGMKGLVTVSKNILPEEIKDGLFVSVIWKCTEKKKSKNSLMLSSIKDEHLHKDHFFGYLYTPAPMPLDKGEFLFYGRASDWFTSVSTRTVLKTVRGVKNSLEVPDGKHLTKLQMFAFLFEEGWDYIGAEVIIEDLGMPDGVTKEELRGINDDYKAE